ncbi:MAG TPA: alpha/beta hydrolase, partial [Paraburkholderia sp.]
AGTQSREIRQVGLAATRRIAGERFEWIEGSHLYPMERPIETARVVQRMLYAMENGA